MNDSFPCLPKTKCPKFLLMENEIIAYLNLGDKRGISLLYDHYAGALYGIVCRMIPHHEVAEDVLQDAFVKIWENADKYDQEKGRLFTWVAQITRNTALDSIKSLAYRQKQSASPVDHSLETTHTVSHIPNFLDAGLHKTVNNLEVVHRQLIDLAYFKGYTQVEIAEKLAMPFGSVKTRIRAAINELRRALKNDIALVA